LEREVGIGEQTPPALDRCWSVGTEGDETEPIGTPVWTLDLHSGMLASARRQSCLPGRAAAPAAARCAPQLTGSAAAGIIGACPVAPGGARLNHTQPCPWYSGFVLAAKDICAFVAAGCCIRPVAPFPSPPWPCTEPTFFIGASFHARHGA